MIISVEYLIAFDEEKFCADMNSFFQKGKLILLETNIM